MQHIVDGMTYDQPRLRVAPDPIKTVSGIAKLEQLASLTAALCVQTQTVHQQI